MEIYKKLNAINAQIEGVKKDKKNQQQGFMYRGIDQFMNSLHPLFAKNGVIVTHEILNAFREERTNARGTVLIWSIIDYKFVFTAEDGSSVCTQARGEAMDSGDKGSNKTLSIALKYALMTLFLIPTEDIAEPDAETHEVINEAMHDAMLAETIEQLKAVWESYPEMQKNKEFAKLIKEQKIKLSQTK